MVKLYDIKTNDNIISCWYAPEDSDLRGYIEVWTDSYQIKTVKYSDYKYGKKTYVAQTLFKLVHLLKSNQDIPSEAVSVWY